MTTVAHILSASLISLFVAKVAPHETALVIIAVISAAALDLDHIYYMVRDKAYFAKHGYKHNLHRARSPLHELVGFSIFSMVALVLSFFDSKLAIVVALPAMIHIVEDVLMGIAMPFNPIDKTRTKLIPQRGYVKVVVDIAIITIFGCLWVQYLSAAN